MQEFCNTFCNTIIGYEVEEVSSDLWFPGVHVVRGPPIICGEPIHQTETHCKNHKEEKT